MSKYTTKRIRFRNGESSFLAFTSALAADRVASRRKEEISPSSRYGSSASGWEHTSIENFLESAVAWGEASNLGIAQGLSLANPWQRFATFLYCVKIYE